MPPPAFAVRLAMTVGGYIFYDTGASIVTLGRKYPGLIERNTLLIYGESDFMHEEGHRGWVVVGWKQLLLPHQGLALVDLSARQIAHACIARSIGIRKRLVWIAPTETIHYTGSSHLHTGEWRVYWRQGPVTHSLRAILRGLKCEVSPPSFAGVYV
jgi:hypothetical protein